MSKYDIVTPDVVRQLLDYDSETGVLTWRARGVSSWDARFAGTTAFTALEDGYHTGTIFRRVFFAHRVAYAHFHGKWPKQHIDHINRKRTDNRISNLRDATPTTNNRNKSRQKNNTSGVTGVSWNRASKAWEAYINVEGKRKRIGMFGTVLQAADARNKELTR